VTTFAGQTSVNGHTDGIGAAAQFNYLTGLATDGTYLWLTENYDYTIRRIALSNAQATTVAGMLGVSGGTDAVGAAARFQAPGSAWLDGTSLFFVDNNTLVRKMDTGTLAVTTLFGQSSGAQSFIQGGGLAAGAQFYHADSVVSDGTYLYISDNVRCTIRKLQLSNNVVTTFAGLAGTCTAADGTGTATARFEAPKGLVIQGGILYVADGPAVRAINLATAVTTTLTGTLGTPGCSSGNSATAAFGTLAGLTSDGTYLYATDTTNVVVHKITIANGDSAILAGSCSVAGSADGVGAAASFNVNINDILSIGGWLYVADRDNYIIRKINPTTGAVTTYAGILGTSGTDDGIGTAATFNGGPYSLAYDGTFLWVSTYQGLRKIDLATATVSTPAFASIDNDLDCSEYACSGHLTHGAKMHFQGGNLFLAQPTVVRKTVVATGATSTLAGLYWVAGDIDGTGIGPTGGTVPAIQGISGDATYLYVSSASHGLIARFHRANSILDLLAGFPGKYGHVDGTGNAVRIFSSTSELLTVGTSLYFSHNNEQTLRKVDLTNGAVSTVAGKTTTMAEKGSVDGVGTAARFDYTPGITNDGTYLYTSEQSNNKIRKVDPATGSVTFLAGSNAATPVAGFADGVGAAALFNNPMQIVRVGGDLYINDYNNLRIRKLNIATQAVTTVVGDGTNAILNGIGTAARIDDMGGLATDGTNLWFTEKSACVLRKVVLSTLAVSTVAGTLNNCAAIVDGIGLASRFKGPSSIVYLGGNLYIADFNTVRMYNPTSGQVTTVAGSTLTGYVNGVGTAARFYNYDPMLFTDGASLFYVEYDTIRRIDPTTFVVDTLVGNRGYYEDRDGLLASAYVSFGGTSIGTVLNGKIYITTQYGIRVISP
jgi:hypothetical protein